MGIDESVKRVPVGRYALRLCVLVALWFSVGMLLAGCATTTRSYEQGPNVELQESLEVVMPFIEAILEGAFAAMASIPENGADSGPIFSDRQITELERVLGVFDGRISSLESERPTTAPTGQGE